jgi:drug/metabolite transporter (DMT)-like permease
MTTQVKIGLIFAVATALFWGLYGPALGKARTDGESPFKPYIFIGLAYLIWGMLGGILAVKLQGGDISLKSFKPESVTWGFIAGTLGAFGALTLTYAMFSAKNASLVMPVVFGGATSVAVLVGLVLQARRGELHVVPQQVVGFVLVVVGIVMLQYYAPHGPAPKKTEPQGDSQAAVESDAPPANGPT